MSKREVEKRVKFYADQANVSEETIWNMLFDDLITDYHENKIKEYKEVS